MAFANLRGIVPVVSFAAAAAAIIILVGSGVPRRVAIRAAQTARGLVESQSRVEAHGDE
jgi:hypothetical protein